MTCPRTTLASAAPSLASPFARPPAPSLLGTTNKYEGQARRKTLALFNGRTTLAREIPTCVGRAIRLGSQKISDLSPTSRAASGLSGPDVSGRGSSAKKNLHPVSHRIGMCAAVLTFRLEAGRNHYGRRRCAANSPGLAVPQHGRLHAREALRNFPQNLSRSRARTALEDRFDRHVRVTNGVNSDDTKKSPISKNPGDSTETGWSRRPAQVPASWAFPIFAMLRSNKQYCRLQLHTRTAPVKTKSHGTGG